MDCYAKFLIQFIYGMQQALREVEVAVFSTHMTNITGLLRRKGLTEGLNEVANVVPTGRGAQKLARVYWNSIGSSPHLSLRTVP